MTPVLGNIFIYSFDVNYIHPVQVSKAVSVLGIHHLRMHFCRVRSRFILNIRMESAALTDRMIFGLPLYVLKHLIRYKMVSNLIYFILLIQHTAISICIIKNKYFKNM